MSLLWGSVPVHSPFLWDNSAVVTGAAATENENTAMGSRREEQKEKNKMREKD